MPTKIREVQRPQVLGYRVDSTREKDMRTFARLGVVFAVYGRLRSSHSILL